MPDDAEKLKSPEYVAVIVSVPAGALLALQLADPDATGRGGAEGG